ncbi:MAG: SoxR reducing system RseC family protein [Eubacteriales bacterium]|nr:SoxR reducing system RseC family protein [Eubacteriales bacterium]
MQETGKIIKVKRGQAVVRVDRKSACGSCGACAMKPSQMHVDISLPNTLGAKVDDVVLVDITGGSVAKMSIVAYLIPIIFAVALLVVFCLIGLPEWVAVVGFFGGLAVGFGVVALFDKLVFSKSENQPRMLKIITDTDIQEEKEKE